MAILDLNNVILETPRLRLVPITQKYREDIFREFTDEITLFMNPPTPTTIADVDKFIMDSTAKRTARREIVFAILDKDTGDFFGNCGVHEIDSKTPELGIWLKASIHGSGYGREVMQALKKWIDDTLDYTYILYPVAVENTASRALAEGLGGEAAREYDATTPSGKVMHEVEYRIYKKV